MAILRKLEAMKEYSDEVSHIESVVKPTNSRGALIAAIQQENRQIKVGDHKYIYHRIAWDKKVNFTGLITRLDKSGGSLTIKHLDKPVNRIKYRFIKKKKFLFHTKVRKLR